MRKLFYIALLLVMQQSVNAQYSPVVSQYMHHALPLNPAFAGSREALSVAASHRSQWVGMPGAPVTHLLSAHAPLKNDRLALGFTAWNEQFGVTRQNTVRGIAAYRLKIKQGHLAFALSGGVSVGNQKWSEVITSGSEDALFDRPDDRFVLPDAGTGIYFHTGTYYLSLSAPQLLSADYSGGGGYRAVFDMNRTPLFFNAGVDLSLWARGSLRPSVMISRQAGGYVQADFNALFVFSDRVEVGGSYRTGRAVIGLMRMSINDQFSIAYAYDHWFSPLSSFQNGTHELTLAFDLLYHHSVSNPRFF